MEYDGKWYKIDKNGYIDDLEESSQYTSPGPIPSNFQAKWQKNDK